MRNGDDARRCQLKSARCERELVVGARKSGELEVGEGDYTTDGGYGLASGQQPSSTFTD